MEEKKIKISKKLIITIAISLLIVGVGIFLALFFLGPLDTFKDFDNKIINEEYEEAYDILNNAKKSNAINSGYVVNKLKKTLNNSYDNRIKTFIAEDNIDESIMEYVENIDDNFPIVEPITLNDIFETQCARVINEKISIDTLENDVIIIDKIDKDAITTETRISFYKQIKEIYDTDNSFSDVIVNLHTIMNIDKEIDEVSKLHDEIIKTYGKRVLYFKAEELYKSGEYKEAYEKYESVTDIDKLYSSDVVDKIKLCSEKINESSLEEIKKLYGQSKYKNAMNLYKSNKEFVENNKDINAVINKCKVDLKKQEIKQIDSYISNEKYKQALECADTLKIYVKDDETTSKYNECNSKYNEYLKQRMLYLKQNITLAYDKVDDKYKVVPKGYDTRYINVNKSINIEPRLYYYNDDNSLTLGCVLGFEQRSWVFFEKIEFVYDGQKKTWTLDYLDRDSQVIWGGIAEWYSVYYDTSDYGNSKIKTDLLDLLESLGNAEQAIIRFSGDGHRDHTLTNAEKSNLKHFVELYKLLEESPNLWKHIKP